ncbi:hypothetical protein T03_8828 [Trichinella britovi]|uniref:Uncharacterized protein n=1 Tax=Trichinella britovi TaxID=45882 RepID=A0A0V1CUV1_TRIBR|nr:hypothetical protein T03_8828 [Trichinella britovi]
MLLMSWSSVVMVLLKVLNEKSSCGPRSAAKTQAVQAELTELNGGHAFQWLQTVHNYARYETHYNYNAGHFFLAPRVGQWAKVSSKKMKKKFLITVHASTLQKQLNPYSQGLLIASEPKKIITTRRKILIDLDQGLVPKVAGSREQNVPRQLADHFDQQDAKPSVCVHAWSKAA